MKSKFIILAFLALTLLAAFALKSNAQYGVQNLKYPSDIPITSDKPELIADETTLTYTKTGVRIDCSNDPVHFKIYQKWQHTFVRYAWSWKKDRKGPYKQYTITVSKKDAELIKEWAKTNL